MKKEFGRGHLTLKAETREEKNLVERIFETDFFKIEKMDMPPQVGEYFKIFRFCGTSFDEHGNNAKGIIFKLEPKIMPVVCYLEKINGRFRDCLQGEDDFHKIRGNGGLKLGVDLYPGVAGVLTVYSPELIEDAMIETCIAAQRANRLPLFKEWFAKREMKRIKHEYGMVPAGCAVI